MRMTSSSHGRSPEIMRADPSVRRRAQIATGIGAIVLIAAILFLAHQGLSLQTWLSQQAEALEALRKTDPIAARERLERTLWMFIALIAALGAITFALCVWYGRKWWKAERWPLADAKLVSDRAILRGSPLRSMAVLIWSAGVLVFCASAYVTVRFSLFVIHAF